MSSPVNGESAIVSPFDRLLGVRVVEADPQRGAAAVTVTPQLVQPDGIVHGGVYATLVESAASLGANAWLRGQTGAGAGRIAVGVNNHTDFVRSVTGGELAALATPLQRGRRLQLWTVDVTDEQGRLVAHGSVRLANVEAGRPR